ncbi:hypothetical protein ACJ41O_007331 [Fusarium nematophilum]
MRTSSTHDAPEVGKPSLDVIEDVAGLESVTLDRETNKRILRKIDWQLMPVLCVTYALQYYDKAVISQAAIFGLRSDLGLESGLRYSWVMLIFFFGHMIGMYPCSLLAQRFRPRRVCSSLNILWAIIVLTTPACKSYGGILANRFFLGLVESGISPIFMLVVGLWYTHEEHSMRSSWWYSFSGGSLLISPLINYGLAHIEGGRLATWHYMFIVAGAITLVWGIALIWIFPDTPQEAKGWSPEDKRLLLERIRRDNSGTENTSLKPYQVWEALKDYQWKVPSSMPAGRIVGLYLINFFAACWLQAISLGTSNVAGYSKKDAYAAGIWVEYCFGNIIGPLLFDAKYGPRYDESFIGILVCFATLLTISIILRLLLSRRNAGRNEKYGEPEFQHGLEDVTDKENKSFRYTL